MSDELQHFYNNTQQILVAHNMKGMLDQIVRSVENDCVSKFPDFYNERVAKHTEYRLATVGVNRGEWKTIEESAKRDATRNGGFDQQYYYQRIMEHTKYRLEAVGVNPSEWATINQSARNDAANHDVEFKLEKFKGHTEWVLNATNNNAILADINVATSRSSHFAIRVARQKQTPQCTLGFLFVNGTRLCDTLELPWKDNQQSISRIPAGTYSGFLRYDKSDHWRIQLTGVPGRTAIQIHIGNFTSDIEGCILVGTGFGSDGQSVTGSATAYAALRKSFYGTDTPVMSPNSDITVTLSDDFPTSYSADLYVGRWTQITDGKPMSLQTLRGQFQISQSGTWRLIWQATTSKPQTKIDWYDFNIAGLDGKTLFTIRAMNQIDFNQSTINFDSGPIADQRISSQWQKISGIGEQRANSHES